MRYHQILFFIFDKRECLDHFEYLTIPLGICSPPVPHTLSYYKEKFHRGSPKMLVKGFESKIL